MTDRRELEGVRCPRCGGGSAMIEVFSHILRCGCGWSRAQGWRSFLTEREMAAFISNGLPRAGHDESAAQRAVRKAAVKRRTKREGRSR